ncbi:MAG: radical SAM protein [Candidatus Gastranaerophilales bacterium]|nr:radical SAM protein [Candidatus Gastranaerophilales bacterium]
MNEIINPSKLFDLLRDTYAQINYSRFFEKTGYATLPLRYFFELTHLCNLNCPYCYVGENRIKEELSTQQWLDIIEQIPFYSFVTLVGGEPLIRKDFCEILHAVSKKTFGKVNVVTNGILMNDEIIDSFIDSKMLLLSVSLDGWKKNHDKNRNKEGIFEIISNNLQNLKERIKEKNSKLMIDIKTIVLKDNLEDILKLYEYATNMGFEYLSISFLRNNNLKQNSNLHETFDEIFYKPEYKIEQYFDLEKFERIYREIQKMKKFSKTKLRFSPKFDNDNPEVELNLIKKFFTQYQDIPIQDIYKPCKYPYANTIINPSGDVYPCLSYKMGNLKENTLKEIINSTKYRCFRKNLKYSKVFSSCQMCCELKVKDI